MLGLLAGAVLLATAAQDPQVTRGLELFDADGKTSRLLLTIPTDPLDPPKASPKKFGDPPVPWLFPFVVNGFVAPRPDAEEREIRFRVFSQERKSENDPALLAARMLLRLWDMNHRRLRFDHAPIYNFRIVDFYLAAGGPAGGEQLFDEDEEGGIRRKVNTIYIYRVQTFTLPIEMAREVAHEYGHACLPPVGGFQEPEDWANGYLGEKLYLRWLRDEIRAERLWVGDAMGASLEQLDEWVRAHVDPLVVEASARPPDFALLRGRGKRAMDAYLGLKLYVESLFPDVVFARSLRLIGSTEAKDYPQGLALAIEEHDAVELTIPTILKGRAIWIPVPKGMKVDGARVLKRQGDWSQVQPTGAVRLVK
jgi:hypothetical protein